MQGATDASRVGAAPSSANNTTTTTRHVKLERGISNSISGTPLPLPGMQLPTSVLHPGRPTPTTNPMHGAPVRPQLRLSALVNTLSTTTNTHTNITNNNSISVPALRLVPPCAANLAIGLSINHAPGLTDAESPVDVRALASASKNTNNTNTCTTPSTPMSATHPNNNNSSTKLQLPELTQNEIKKAQNRKSAKRFREAQKRRWQLLTRELEAQKRLVEELRNSNNKGMSIGCLTTSSEIEVDTEASLYAQLLCSSISGINGCPAAYVGELGTLHRCILLDRRGNVKGLRRGGNNTKKDTNSNMVGDNLFKHISPLDAPNVRNALASAVDIVAIGYVRNSTRFNAVVKPVPNCEDVLLAEFLPFNTTNTTSNNTNNTNNTATRLPAMHPPHSNALVSHPPAVAVSLHQLNHHHHQRDVLAPPSTHIPALDTLPRNINMNVNNNNNNSKRL